MAKIDQIIKRKYNQSYYEKIDFIYRIVSEKFNRLSDSDNIFNNKVGFVLAGLIPLMGFYFSLWDKISQTVLILGIVLAFFSTIFLLLALHTRKFYDAPKMDELFSKESFEKDIFDLKNDVSAKLIGDYHQNNNTIRSKSILFTIAIYILLVSILVVFFGFVYNGVDEIKTQASFNSNRTERRCHYRITENCRSTRGRF